MYFTWVKTEMDVEVTIWLTDHKAVNCSSCISPADSTAWGLAARIQEGRRQQGLQEPGAWSSQRPQAKCPTVRAFLGDLIERNVVNWLICFLDAHITFLLLRSVLLKDEALAVRQPLLSRVRPADLQHDMPENDDECLFDLEWRKCGFKIWQVWKVKPMNVQGRGPSRWCLVTPTSNNRSSQHYTLLWAWHIFRECFWFFELAFYLLNLTLD